MFLGYVGLYRLKKSVASHAEEEEVVEHGDGGHHPHERLAVEGKDGQKEDRVGMEMEHVVAVMVENGVEEAGERRNQPCPNVVQEEGIEGVVRGLRLGEGEPKHRLSPFAVIARRREKRNLELLLGNGGRDQHRLKPGRVGSWGWSFSFLDGHRARAWWGG